MLALFTARAREVALTMLRESEAQLIRVLSRTEGGGAPAAQLDLETDKIVATLNDVLAKYFRTSGGKAAPAVKVAAFDTVRPALEEQARKAGADTAEAALRRTYDRMLQIQLHLLGAPLDAKLRAELKRVRHEIDEHEAWFRKVHIVEGQNPIGDMWVGPVGPMQRAQKVYEEGEERNAKLQRLRPQREALEKGQRDLESALPLLGGFDDDQLTKLSALKGAEEFDRMRDAAVARILGNVEKVRKDIVTGERNLWLVDKVVERTKLAFGVEAPPANDAQKAWARSPTRRSPRRRRMPPGSTTSWRS